MSHGCWIHYKKSVFVVQEKLFLAFLSRNWRMQLWFCFCVMPQNERLKQRMKTNKKRQAEQHKTTTKSIKRSEPRERENSITSIFVCVALCCVDGDYRFFSIFVVYACMCVFISIFILILLCKWLKHENHQTQKDLGTNTCTQTNKQIRAHAHTHIHTRIERAAGAKCIQHVYKCVGFNRIFRLWKNLSMFLYVFSFPCSFFSSVFFHRLHYYHHHRHHRRPLLFLSLSILWVNSFLYQTLFTR